ncbi:quinoprotein dehydrogenase-associated SoxYZ-like carrier [Alkalilimnicola ehrlichii MLHE-1]|uniref:Quinoprotein dehydrogenase-associated SoxYZ-like carrier n=1 Tax=Alkalilimnicola ehrlichii (strain ATCC BAA-1101 / DSM 17681 / MLHE-1) TaxID=187272 RepID=Q0A515_ALKEH|nr:quinoprotein dehydrogenase-associated SoxYZ-like carrier [Alkalilimnicola ehrlichii]ABI58072.1 conserved hypothetical protein [Alkalilimnicola ehrlichii MLHE-1]
MRVSPHLLPLCLLLAAALAAPAAAGVEEDPLGSPGWHLSKARYFQGETYVFAHDKVQVIAPDSAEDTFQVPGFVRVEGLGNVRRLMVFTDLNPIPKILDMEIPRGAPNVGFRFKVEQATALRAAAQTEDGVWHLGGTWIDAAGGGCSAPSIASADPAWESRLGEIRGRTWQREGSQRVRFSLLHPMDTGLAPGIPEFYLEELEVRDGNDQTLARMEIHASMSENPHLTLDLEHRGTTRLVGRDNNGNRFEGTLQP